MPESQGRDELMLHEPLEGRDLRKVFDPRSWCLFGLGVSPPSLEGWTVCLKHLLVMSWLIQAWIHTYV